MGKVIEYTNDDGKKCYIRPNYSCGLTIEQIAEKDVPSGKAYQIIEAEDIPVVPEQTPEESFNVESFQESLFGALMQGQFSSPSIRSEFAQVTAFVTGTKQFAMLKQYLGWLMSQAIITEADYGVVAAVLALQNIDLGGY